ncbi:cation:proton antiporter [Geothrix sp. 21YS21S-2]|uniref:cation:proton antiporter n=1 Tax=Geothrix sp. 21YS21S-2 TaxID=3068893 RepID=UPI0027B92750|nr:cation:proton antiporter [Geothrix sp. 21YS21S-2]
MLIALAPTSSPAILADLAKVLGVSALTTIACRTFRLPTVLGYLIAGLIIGPHVPIPMVADPGNVHTLSELGVILLMFTLGLEFSLAKVARAGPAAALVAVTQAGFMIWMGYLAGRMVGFSAVESLFAGAALAISSTMIIARAFEELGIKGPLSELVISALIVEDLLAILLLALLGAVASGAGFNVAALGLTAARLAAFLAVVLALGLWLLPRWVRRVAALGHDETLLIAVAGLCFSFSLLAAKAGYSVALGAFLGGMVVAESGLSHKVEALLAPLRDLFVAVFFVSIGMSLDPGQLMPNWKALVLFGLLVLVGKFASASAGALLGGNSLRTSLRTGASLAQIGEFSFIIAALGQSLGVVGPALFPVLVATCAWTTLTTPLLIGHSETLADRIERALPSHLRHFLLHHRTAMGHLREAPFSRSAGSRLRRPFGLLLLFALLTAALVVLGTFLGRSPALSTSGAGGGFAKALAWAGAAGIGAALLAGMVQQTRTLARALAEGLERTGRPSGKGVGDAIRFILELAIGCLVGLPLLAVLQPFLPVALVLTAVPMGLILLAGVFFRRTGRLLERRELPRDEPPPVPPEVS